MTSHVAYRLFDRLPVKYPVPEMWRIVGHPWMYQWRRQFFDSVEPDPFGLPVHISCRWRSK